MPTIQTEPQKFDIVRFPGGAEFIITEFKRNRPVNPYVGIKVNGRGAAYKFGPRHHPTVVGHAPDNHPALVAYRARRESSGTLDLSTKGVIMQLLSAVEIGDMPTAQILASAARTMSCWSY